MLGYVVLARVILERVLWHVTVGRRGVFDSGGRSAIGKGFVRGTYCAVRAFSKGS